VKAVCADVRIYRINKTRLPLNVIAGWLNRLPASVAFFLDQKQKRLMQEDIIRLQPQHVFVQLIRAAEYIRVLPIPKTLDYMDVFSFGATQRAHHGSLFLRPFFALEAKRLRKYEKSVYNDFTNHVIISAQDRDRLPLPYQGSVTILSNGVDLEYFAPIKDEPLIFDIVFVGNLGYLPNIEAAEYLVKQIMPIVRRQFPNARVCLAGARPHRRVQQLSTPLVEVTGWVDDIRPTYAKGRIFVAPMLSGMGQQNKILEAMAMERPCITTPMVDNAIGAASANALLIAEDRDTFAQAICRLLADSAEATRLGKQAREFVLQQYSWEIQNKVLDSLFVRNLAQSQAHGQTQTMKV
jgi:glycosyltransferase involved in cell wall biosynthesis